MRRDGILASVDDMDEAQISKSFGWASVALGLTLLAAPGAVAKAVGVKKSPAVARILEFIAIREVGTGALILTEPPRARWLWSRFAGDVMDLAFLAGALASHQSRKASVAMSLALVGTIAAVDLIAAERMAEISTPRGRAMRSTKGTVTVVKAITVGRSAEDLYRTWRELDKLPRFLKHVERVEVFDDGRSHWSANSAIGRNFEWDSRITEDLPNERIAWTSTGGDIETSGSVSFQPAVGNRGTVVRVEIQFSPPGGKLTAAVARLLRRSPEQEVEDNLRRFKQLMEAGDIVETDSTVKGWGSAQPSAEPPSVRH